MTTLLTNEVKLGWHEQVNGSTRDRPNGKANPYLWSSDAWLAFEAGQSLGSKGYSAPIKATKSRGFAVRVFTEANEFLFKASGADLEHTELVRK